MASSKLTPKKKELFLKHLAETGSVTLSTQAIGTPRTAPYDLRPRDPEFVRAWDMALEAYAEKLEREADRRAMEGIVTKTIYDEDGKKIDEVRYFSDTLLIFRLKGLKPKMYKDRVEIGGDQDNPIIIKTPEQRQARIADLLRKRGDVEPLAIVDPE